MSLPKTPPPQHVTDKHAPAEPRRKGAGRENSQSELRENNNDESDRDEEAEERLEVVARMAKVRETEAALRDKEAALLAFSELSAIITPQAAAACARLLPANAAAQLRLAPSTAAARVPVSKRDMPAQQLQPERRSSPEQQPERVGKEGEDAAVASRGWEAERGRRGIMREEEVRARGQWASCLRERLDQASSRQPPDSEPEGARVTAIESEAEHALAGPRASLKEARGDSEGWRARGAVYDHNAAMVTPQPAQSLASVLNQVPPSHGRAVTRAGPEVPVFKLGRVPQMRRVYVTVRALAECEVVAEALGGDEPASEYADSRADSDSGFKLPGPVPVTVESNLKAAKPGPD
eukprot:117998-Rhodomonas_salina.1